MHVLYFLLNYFPQFSLSLSLPHVTTLPKLRAFIFYARRLCYPFFLTLPDSWLLVKHAYISDGFKPATGRRSTGRIFLNYEPGVVESCMYTDSCRLDEDSNAS